MKVLFLTTSYPTAEDPVPGVFVQEYVAAVRPYCDVAVVHLQRANVRWIEVARDEEAWRVRYPSRPATPWHLAAAWRGLRLERGYDLVHAHFFLAAFPAVSLQRRPVVVTEHWSVFLPEDPATLGPFSRRAARFAFNRAAAVLPVSSALRDAIAALGVRTPLEVVPNAVDTALFHPGKNDRPTGMRLLSVGLIYEAKAHDVLLSAVALLRNAGFDAQLDVVGDGPLRVRTQRLAERLGIASNVAFHGMRTKREIAKLMRQSDLFVLSSRYENNPCAVLEALVSGLPVVATGVGGLPELVDERSGILVRPGDPRALAEGIVQAYERRYDRFAIAAAAAPQFAAQQVGERLASIYRDVLTH